MGEESYRYVGKKLPPIDSVDKVTGKAIYGADVILPGMLYAKLLHSPHPRARIKRLDISAARSIPGVRAVVTAENAPDSRFGISIRDERFFAKDEVWFAGEEIAAVVALNGKIAQRALKEIRVEYEPLEAILDPWEAIRPDAPKVRSDVESNICYRIEISRGDLQAALHESAVICEEIFILNHQYQAYIEPHSATASWENNRLTLWVPHQAPQQLEKVICEALGIERGSFRFIQTCLGGGYGGKTHSRVAPIVALLSRIVCAPVQLSLSREEDFKSAFPSVPMYIQVKMGAREDGLIIAKDVHIIADNGAFTASALGVVEVAAARVDSLYKFRNLHVLGELVYTNKLGTSAFRGYGNSQMHFAIESMMDIVAERLSMDPMEIRIRNAVEPGYVSAHGYVIGNCQLSESIREAARISEWNKKRGQMRAQHRGIGMACGMHVSGSTLVKPLGSVANIRVHHDGTVHLMSSEGDIGQGANTAFAIMISEVLDVPLKNVRVSALDSDEIGFSVGAVGSRVTVVGGGAVWSCAKEIHRKLIDLAGEYLGCDAKHIKIVNGKAVDLQSEREVEIADLAKFYSERSGGGLLMAEVIHTPVGVELPDGDKYGNISSAYAFATHVAEVEVDHETGKVVVLQLTAVHDSGQVINLLTAEGQVEGALVQGMGWALFEELLFDQGRLVNNDFTNYRVPTFRDEPNMKVHFLDGFEERGPFGAKSLGEVAMVPVAPAIVNAIYDATGIRLYEIPATPERVLMAMRERRR
jgi:CO/xanthine dehydrogenase Mo-binding subunit